MKKTALILLSTLLIGSLFSCSGSNQNREKVTDATPESDVTTVKSGTVDAVPEDTVVIHLNDSSADINGTVIPEYDYTWHADPGTVHEDVKNAPAEYYTGTLPENPGDVYIDHELYYFPRLDTDRFSSIDYDGEKEWAYYYNDGVNDSFIFATLPSLGNRLPTSMMHSEDEAAENKVLHITKAGTYLLSGTFRGQIRIDLGDKDTVSADSSQSVTLILNGVDIHCSAAPAIIFDSLYECDSNRESSAENTCLDSLDHPGAVIVIADDSENKVEGCNVYRMLKTKYKDDESTDAVKVQKKLRKTDAALYSCVSLQISGASKGNGRLQITSSFEGLDSELHMEVCSGHIIIHSQDDGINVNEDHLSTFIMSGGVLTINAGEGDEGDGIDSNGFALIRGGTLWINHVTPPDYAIDTEDGVHYEGGTIFIDQQKIDCEIGKEYREISGSDRRDTKPDGFPPDGTGGDGLNRRADNGNDKMPPDAPFPEDKDFDFGKFREAVNQLPDDATLNDVIRLLGAEKPDDNGQFFRT